MSRSNSESTDSIQTESGAEISRAGYSVYERAALTEVPYIRQELFATSGEAVRSQFNSAEYSKAQVEYKIVVDEQQQAKVLARGYLWGDEASTHQRYRAQYRREKPPTQTTPFTAYDTWIRYQVGTISGSLEDDISFTSDTSPSEKSREFAWDELFPMDQIRIIEAELVRNPELARLRLKQLDWWDDVIDILRYHPSVFDKSP